MSSFGSVLVWGAGGHGRVVAEVAVSAGWDLAGFADRDPESDGPARGEARVIATEAALRSAVAEGRGLPGGVAAIALGVGDNSARLAALEWLPAAALPLLVHKSAILSPTVSLGRGTVVMAGTVINAASRIGSAVIVNTGAVVDHDCRLDDGVHISPGAVLCGDVTVAELAWIGAGATILPGVRIGAGAVVGAGSTVVRDVPAGAVVAGNPAKPLPRPGSS